MTRGTTLAEREQARAGQRAKRRAAAYQHDIRSAATAKDRLAHVCRYLRAVADDLTDTAITEITAEVLAIANRRNNP